MRFTGLPGIFSFSGALKIRLKNLLDREVKQSCDFERQWQSGIKLAGFDRINCLPRYLQAIGQIRLSPVVLGAKYAQSVFHR